jgi:hypothetical protein
MDVTCAQMEDATHVGAKKHVVSQSAMTSILVGNAATANHAWKK